MFPSFMEADDYEPHLSAFILGDSDEMVEHGTSPQTIAAYIPLGLCNKDKLKPFFLTPITSMMSLVVLTSHTPMA